MASKEPETEENLFTKSPSYRALNRALKEEPLSDDEQINRYLTENGLTELPGKIKETNDLIAPLEQQAKLVEKERNRKERMSRLRILGQTTPDRTDLLQGIFNEGGFACGPANMMLADLAAVDQLIEQIAGGTQIRTLGYETEALAETIRRQKIRGPDCEIAGILSGGR